ncbi:polyhomeotic-like protein 3 isoform X2 [Artemia franciscana]|uniref:polyhomeotic-like protein 3 isoform X2 n=1 Tax=Artemia franciscana TaxID=6661 RepID=UPI0032DA3D26
MAEVKTQPVQASPVSVTYSIGSVPNQTQQQGNVQTTDQQQQIQQQGLQQSLQVQQQQQQPTQFVFQQASGSAQSGQVGVSGANAATSMANVGGLNMTSISLQHGQTGQSVQHSNISSSALPTMPQLQVIQQPMGGGSYIQQLYNTQGQPILMPSGVLQHGVNQPIQVITAGKPFQGTQIGGSHMIAGKQIVQTGQTVNDWNQFRGATYIPTSGQGQTLVISQLGQLGTVLSSSQANILTANQSTTKNGDQKPYLQVVNSINQKGSIVPVSVSNGVGVNVGVPAQLKSVNPGGNSMTSQPQVGTTQTQSTMVAGQTQLISPLQYLPQQFNLGQGFTWATGPNGIQQPILSHNPPIYIRSGTQADGSGGMIFAAPAQQQMQPQQQAIAPIGQIGVAPQVRNRQPGEVNVGPPIQPKLVVPRQATSTPQHIRPAPASSVSTQTITAQNSGTIKSKVRKMAAQKTAQQVAKQNIENAVRAGLITPIMAQQGQLQFVNQQGQIQQYQLQQNVQGNMVQFTPQMPMLQIVGTPQAQSAPTQQHNNQSHIQIMHQSPHQVAHGVNQGSQGAQSISNHQPSPSSTMSPHPSQSPRPFQHAQAAAPSPSSSPSVMQSPRHVSQSPVTVPQSPHRSMQSPSNPQLQQMVSIPTSAVSQMMSPRMSPRPQYTVQQQLGRQTQTPPITAQPATSTHSSLTPTNGVITPTSEPDTVAPSPLQQIQLQVQQQFSPLTPPLSTSLPSRFPCSSSALLATTTSAPSQMPVLNTPFGASTVTVQSRPYRPIAPAPVAASPPMTSVPFKNLPPNAPPIAFPPPSQEVPPLLPQISVPSISLTLPYVSSASVSNSSMVSIPSSALVGAPLRVSSPILTMPDLVDLMPIMPDEAKEKTDKKGTPDQRDANQNLNYSVLKNAVPESNDMKLECPVMEKDSNCMSPSLKLEINEEPEEKKSSILTHVIGDFLIHESSEPFPVVRLFPPSPGKKKARAEEGPPRKKIALDCEMATCKECGITDTNTKFDKTKSYCSLSCGKKVKQVKTETISKEKNKEQEMSSLTNGITPMSPMPSPTTSVHPPVLSVPGGSPLKSSEEMSDKDLDAELVMLAAQQNIQVVEARISPPVVKNDPSKWTARDVAEFVRNLPGCDEYADEFLVQEIDGQALMLLKADHLMSAMNMKLGPALKICAKIESMRSEANK